MAARSVELGWVRIFAEVGRLGSLSSAASALGLTQPAVSYQIRRLEEQMGTSLLHRRHRGVELTLEGKRLFEIAAKAVDDVDSLVKSFRTETDRPTIRLRTDYAFSALWLIPRMHNFRLLYPEMDIQIVATQRLERGFRDDGDVAVAFGTSAEFGVDGTLLLKEKVAPVCTQGFLDRNGPFDDPRRLAKSTLIHLDALPPSPWFDWRGYLAEFDVGRDTQAGAGDISFNTYSLVVQAALGGQGLALGWMGLVDPLLSARLLTIAGPPLESPDRGYWLLPPKSRSAHTDRLITWLIDEAGISSA
jgi:putative choline sulfate-utilization transcription factor